MEILEKAKLLAGAGRYDSCGPKACEVKIAPGLGEIYDARAEHKTYRLFKTLMTNKCTFDCKILPAKRITKIRSKTKITKYEQLHNIGGHVKRAKPFIKVGGKTQRMLSES